MKEAKNELLQFVGGVIMLVVGLYILSQKVMVSSSYGFFSLWGGRFSSGLSMNGFLYLFLYLVAPDWLQRYCLLTISQKSPRKISQSRQAAVIHQV